MSEAWQLQSGIMLEERTESHSIIITFHTKGAPYGGGSSGCPLGAWEVFQTRPVGRRPRGRPRARWRTPAWECLGIPPARAGQSGPGKGSLGPPA